MHIAATLCGWVTLLRTDNEVVGLLSCMAAGPAVMCMGVLVWQNRKVEHVRVVERDLEDIIADLEAMVAAGGPIDSEKAFDLDSKVAVAE